jgi:hypothetical protein
MNLRTLLGLFLITWLILVIIPFERRYKTTLVMLGQHPAVRLVASVLVLWMASIDPMLGALGFMILFLWVADIQLLSSMKLSDPK